MESINQKLESLLKTAEKAETDGDTNLAKETYLEVLNFKPDSINALNFLGHYFLTNNDLLKAEKYYTKSANTEPSAGVYNNLGIIEVHRGNQDEAKKWFQKANNFDKSFPDSLNNLAKILCNEGSYQEALNLYKDMLLKYPQNPNILTNIGNTYYSIGNYKNSLNYLQRAHDLDKDNPRILMLMGLSLLSLGKINESIEKIADSIKIQPSAEAFYNLSLCYFDMEDYKNADICLVSAIKLNPTPKLLAYISHGLITCLLYFCDFSKLEISVDNFLETFNYLNSNHTHLNLSPFYLLATTLPQDLIFEMAKQYSNKYKSEILEKNNQTVKSEKLDEIAHHVISSSMKDKINIGYISPDFNKHPVGILVNKLFSFHNRTKFHICAFLTSNKSDKQTEIIKDTVDEFYDINDMDSLQANRLIKSKNIHILVDLAGLTKGCRLDILGTSPAPIICTTLGYTGTTGASYIDYYICDKNLITNGSANYFTEKRAMLNTCLFATSKFEIPKILPKRQDYNLKDDAIVFCSFCESYRISENTMNCWVKILSKVPNSILWLRKMPERALKNVTSYLTNRDINASRLVFLDDKILTEKFQHQLADIWLDTLSVSSGTGVFLALSANVPMICLDGETPQSRTSSSLLKSSNLDELVAINDDEYVEIAVQLGNNPDKLKVIKDKIKNNIDKMPIFNQQEFIHDLENLYLNMIDNYQNNNTPVELDSCIVEIPSGDIE